MQGTINYWVRHVLKSANQDGRYSANTTLRPDVYHSTNNQLAANDVAGSHGYFPPHVEAAQLQGRQRFETI